MCLTEFSIVAHDEVIILSLPCDLSARGTLLVVFHLLTWILRGILETVSVVLRCLANKPVVKWFAQR